MNVTAYPTWYFNCPTCSERGDFESLRATKHVGDPRSSNAPSFWRCSACGGKFRVVASFNHQATLEPFEGMR